MTIEEAKIILINRGVVEVNGYQLFNGDKWRNAIAVISKWLEQEPCEDCISRQAVLDGLASIAKVKARSDAQKSLMGRIMFFVEQLPSVTPKEKTGHWINNHTQCSNCEWGIEDDVVGSPMMLFFPFCPNCGARMVEPQESEDKE